MRQVKRADRAVSKLGGAGQVVAQAVKGEGRRGNSLMKGGVVTER